MKGRYRNLRRVLVLAGSMFLVDSLISQQPGNTEREISRLTQLGQAALAADKYPEAQDYFQQLAKLEPEVAEVHATLAAIDFKLRAYRSAVQEIATARKLKPSLPRLDILLALSQSELGHLTEALPGLEKGFKQTSDSEIRRMCGLELVRAYTNLNRDSDAVLVALTLYKNYPNDPEVLYQAGRIFGNYTYSIMEKLHDSAPDSVWMILAQAESYESQKEYDSAIQTYRRVLTVDPNHPGIHYRIGRTFLRRFQSAHQDRDRASAQEEFREELKIDPLNENSAYELAQIDYDSGNLDAARVGFERVLAVRPDFEQAQVGLAGVLLEQQKDELALPHLRDAIKLDAADEVAWYRLARALRSSGDSEGQKKAMIEFRRLHAMESGKEAQTGLRATSNEVTPQHLDTDKPPQ